MSGLARILVVDDSRTERAGLVGKLDGRFDVREEGDGESAWQTLVLDSTIRAVISDLHMPKLNGHELLERLRSSRLRRLKEMPFMLMTGDEGENDRLRAKALGVSDFVTKGTGSTELLTRLQHLLELSAARDDLADGRERMVQDPFTGLYTAKYLELQAAQALSNVARNEGEVSVIVLAFDGLATMRERMGNDVTEQVTTRFAKMLAGKMRREDSLGHYGEGQYAIVSPGTSPALSTSFAERVREAVEVARVAVQGQPLSLTVSVGVSSVPMDRVTSAGGFLELAARRMNEAMQAGGNRIVAGSHDKYEAKALSLRHALELLASGRPELVRPHLSALTVQLMPLLRMMNEELALELPLQDLEKRLKDRVKQ